MWPDRVSNSGPLALESLHAAPSGSASTGCPKRFYFTTFNFFKFSTITGAASLVCINVTYVSVCIEIFNFYLTPPTATVNNH